MKKKNKYGNIPSRCLLIPCGKRNRKNIEALFGRESEFEGINLKGFEWIVCGWQGCLD